MVINFITVQGGGGVKKGQKTACILNQCPLINILEVIRNQRPWFLGSLLQQICIFSINTTNYPQAVELLIKRFWLNDIRYMRLADPCWIYLKHLRYSQMILWLNFANNHFTGHFWLLTWFKMFLAESQISGVQSNTVLQLRPNTTTQTHGES